MRQAQHGQQAALLFVYQCYRVCGREGWSEAAARLTPLSRQFLRQIVKGVASCLVHACDMSITVECTICATVLWEEFNDWVLWYNWYDEKSLCSIINCKLAGTCQWSRYEVQICHAIMTSCVSIMMLLQHRGWSHRQPYYIAMAVCTTDLLSSLKSILYSSRYATWTQLWQEWDVYMYMYIWLHVGTDGTNRLHRVTGRESFMVWIWWLQWNRWWQKGHSNGLTDSGWDPCQWQWPGWRNLAWRT